jgi:zinc transport system ATP-binding protein
MKQCHCSAKVHRLSVKREGHFILDNVSFTVNHGEITALIGRNGAGKTTLLEAVINSVPHSGFVDFFDSQGKKVSNPKIGYVPQKLNFDKNSPITVLDLFCSNSVFVPLWLGHSKRRTVKAREILKKVGAEKNINKLMGELSGGELQRVLLAFALDPMPDILLLDEPLSAVDKRGAEQLYSLLISMREEYHMPIVLVSHDLASVYKYMNNYVLIDSKVLEIGKAVDMYESEKVREALGFSGGDYKK